MIHIFDWASPDPAGGAGYFEVPEVGEGGGGGGFGVPTPVTPSTAEVTPQDVTKTTLVTVGATLHQPPNTSGQLQGWLKDTDGNSTLVCVSGAAANLGNAAAIYVPAHVTLVVPPGYHYQVVYGNTGLGAAGDLEAIDSMVETPVG